MTGPQILDEVRGRRVSALPDRLEVAIEGWCGSRRPLRATTAWVITCDPKALRALRTVDLESIGAHIDPPFIWVPLDRKDDFTAVLREMGVAWVDGPTP